MTEKEEKTAGEKSREIGEIAVEKRSAGEIKERDNLLWILKETKNAVKKNDVVKIKELSNHTLHTSSIQQDSDSVAVAVIIYALSKIIERRKYTYYKEWPSFYKNYLKGIEKAIQDLQKNDAENFREDIKKIRDEIGKLSGNFKKYIQDVFRKAEINKASRIYEHGISMEKTAKLLGITMWELAEYAGQTGVSDVNLTVTMPIKKRIKQAEEIFKA